jgi:hypothetical protein
MSMHPDLEMIVSADEEARSRLALAEQRREQQLSAERATREASIDARRNQASEALERELQKIRAEGDVRVAELQRQQEQYLASLAAVGERQFDEAVKLYLRIVCEAAS